jgi:environmental stress-induced protein Ves
MKINLTKKEQLQTSTWAGGTTTQLVIFPEDAVYKNLDFTFRISSATIEVEESTFTTLPNVSRVIMVLNGELTLLHKNQYIKQLKKFDTDHFSGDWETTSVGKATDFNVMTRGRAKASASGFSLKGKSEKDIRLNSNITAVYVYSGEVSAKNIPLMQGDMILLTKENDNENFTLEVLKNSDIALAEIWL